MEQAQIIAIAVAAVAVILLLLCSGGKKEKFTTTQAPAGFSPLAYMKRQGQDVMMGFAGLPGKGEESSFPFVASFGDGAAERTPELLRMAGGGIVLIVDRLTPYVGGDTSSGFAATDSRGSIWNLVPWEAPGGAIVLGGQVIRSPRITLAHQSGGATYPGNPPGFPSAGPAAAFAYNQPIAEGAAGEAHSIVSSGDRGGVLYYR